MKFYIEKCIVYEVIFAEVGAAVKYNNMKFNLDILDLLLNS